MTSETSFTSQKPRSRGAALIKTNAQVRSEMARIYRSFNAGDITMDEMNKRVAVLDKIRLTLIEHSKPKLEADKSSNAPLTIREKLIANRIERSLVSRLSQLIGKNIR